MSPYTVALLAHILVVVYLLGTDAGRLYLAGRVAAPDEPLEARLAAARGVLRLGSITDTALVLLLPAGVAVGATLGVFRIASPTWLTATGAVTAGWLVLTHAADFSATHPGGLRHLTGFDTVFRLLMGAGQVYDGSIVLAGTNVSVDARWLGIKILVFGLLILLSVPTRRILFALRRDVAALSGPEGQPDAVAAGRLTRTGARLPLMLVASWGLVLTAAWMGVAKPF